MVDAGGDATGFAGACVVVGACVTVGVIPAVCGQQAVPVGGGVVAAAGEVGVVEEVVVVSWFGSVDLWVDGEEVDEPGGCVGWFEVGDGVAVLEGVFASVFVGGGWCDDVAAYASDVESFAEAFACVVAYFDGGGEVEVASAGWGEDGDGVGELAVFCF